MSDSSPDPASVGHVPDKVERDLYSQGIEGHRPPWVRSQQERARRPSVLDRVFGRSGRRQPSQETSRISPELQRLVEYALAGSVDMGIQDRSLWVDSPTIMHGRLLEQIRQQYDLRDPMPEGLAERSLWAISKVQSSATSREGAEHLQAFAQKDHGSTERSGVAQEPVDPDLARASSDTRPNTSLRSDEVPTGVENWAWCAMKQVRGYCDVHEEHVLDAQGAWRADESHDLSVEALASLAHMAGGEREEARAREIALVVHHLPDSPGAQMRPTCGVGVLDWFKATSSWDKVTCERCLEVGHGLGDLGAPEVMESPASDERPESISMTLPAGTPVEFMDGDRVVGSGHALPDGSVVGSVSHPATVKGLTIRLADGSEEPYETHLEKARMAREDLVAPEGRQGIARERFDLQLCHGTRLYWCPTTREIECPEHGGFSTCCEHPNLHWDIDRIERFLKHATEASDASQGDS